MVGFLCTRGISGYVYFLQGSCFLVELLKPQRDAASRGRWRSGCVLTRFAVALHLRSLAVGVDGRDGDGVGSVWDQVVQVGIGDGSWNQDLSGGGKKQKTGKLIRKVLKSASSKNKARL